MEPEQGQQAEQNHNNAHLDASKPMEYVDRERTNYIEGQLIL